MTDNIDWEAVDKAEVVERGLLILKPNGKTDVVRIVI